MRFNFSAFNDKLETLEERFEGYCFNDLRRALERLPDLFPEEALRRILVPPAIDGRLQELFAYAGEHRIPLYVLIDEYDNFANSVLAHRGREAYESFTRGGGFYRNFFAALKAGAGEEGGGLDRLFVTGVSPITMDDVTSGFNIGVSPQESIPAHRRRIAPSQPRYPGRRTRDPLPQHLSGADRALGTGSVGAHRADTDSTTRRTTHRNVPSTGNFRKLKNRPLINQLNFVTPGELRFTVRSSPPAGRRGQRSRSHDRERGPSSLRGD